MDADGNISTGSGYTVDNECPLGPVVIEKIKVVSKSTWSIEDFNADYKNMKASSNKIGLSINGAAVQTNGTLTLNESLRSVIRNKESKALSFEAKLPAQRTAIQDNALGIVFTIDLFRMRGNFRFPSFILKRKVFKRMTCKKNLFTNVNRFGHIN